MQSRDDADNVDECVGQCSGHKHQCFLYVLISRMTKLWKGYGGPEDKEEVQENI